MRGVCGAGALVLLFSALAGLAAPPASGATDPELPLRVVLSVVAPVSPRAADTLTVEGTVTNTGSAPADDLSLLIGIGRRIHSRQELTDDFATPPTLARVLGDGDRVVTQTLAPGGTGHFRARVPLRDAGLGSDATVYPLEVRVDGAEQGAPGPALGRGDTFLPWFPAPVSAPLRVSWLLPLDAPPALDAAGRIDRSTFPSILSGDGRLRRLLDLGQAAASVRRPVPVTFAVEPSLLQAIQAVTHAGWQRSDATRPTGGSAGHPANSDATTFLSDLAAVTAGKTVLALPYADPDAVAETRAGLSLDLATAVATGRSLVGGALPRAAIPDIAWPPGGLVDQATLDAYAAAGQTGVVIDGSQLPSISAASPPTQTAVTALPTRGPTVQALAADPQAQRLLAGAGRDQPTTQMAAQRLLALLAVVVTEAPNGGHRDLVLAAPRTFDPDAAWAGELLNATGSLPWLTGVALADTQGDAPGRRSSLQPYPAAARGAELPSSALVGGTESVSSLRSLVDDVAGMLPDDERLTRPLNQALSRAESVFWRSTSPDGPGAGADIGDRLRRDVGVSARGLLGQVRVAAAGQVTLTSRDGTIPVTVENSLPEPVTVRLALHSADRSKLAAPPGQQVTVAAGRKKRVLLAASTQRAGTFRVQLELTTPDGRTIQAVPVVVHSTAYGRITVAITAGALAVLVLALLVRLIRRWRHWRRRPPGGPEGPPMPAGDDPAPATVASR